MSTPIGKYPTLTASEVYLKAHNNSGFKVGDYVKVVSKAKEDQNGWANCWVEQMNNALGKIFKINYDFKINGFEVSKNGYSFPWFVLQKATREEVEQMMLEDAKDKGFVVGAMVEKASPEWTKTSGKIVKICFYFPGDAKISASTTVEKKAVLGEPFVWVSYNDNYCSPIDELVVKEAPKKVEAKDVNPPKKTKVKQLVFQVIEDEAGDSTYLLNGREISTQLTIGEIALLEGLCIG
jgi:hypothetical protein